MLVTVLELAYLIPTYTLISNIGVAPVSDSRSEGRELWNIFTNGWRGTLVSHMSKIFEVNVSNPAVACA